MSQPKRPTELAAAPTTAEQRDALAALAVEGLIAGKSIRDLAAEHNIPSSTVHGFLLRETGPKYRELQEHGLIARIVAADQELDDAKDHIAISRAREKCKFTRWDAERRLKRLFGPSTEVTGADRGPIVLDSLERARRVAFLNQSVIDVESQGESHAQHLAGALAGVSPALLESVLAPNIHANGGFVNRAPDGGIPDLPGASMASTRTSIASGGA